MNGHGGVFGQLVHKLEQIIPNSSTLQDDQNEWSQCSIWTTGSKVGIYFVRFTSKSANVSEYQASKKIEPWSVSLSKIW